MSDTPSDPFAARPYVPPNERDSQAGDSGLPGKPEDAAEDSAEEAGPFTHRFENEAASQSREELPAESTAQLPPAAPAAPEPSQPAQEPPLSGRWADDYGAPHHTPSHHAAPPPPPRGGGRKVAGALAVALLGGAAGVGGAAAYEELIGPGGGGISSIEAPADTSKLPQTAIEAVADKVRPSVVQIIFRVGDEGGTGTGIIISSDGEILTNNHVVEPVADEGDLVVLFGDGSRAKAKIVGRDPSTDIAVIKVKGKSDLQPAALGKSANLSVGQDVVVVGSPDWLTSTVTSGIISALNRPVALPEGDEERVILPAIQSDAAINQGNSGGPVVDLQGRVVGVVVALHGTVDGGSIGLGFAIPIDLAKYSAGQLIKGEKVEHAQIGVTVSPAVAEDKISGLGAKIQRVLPGKAGAKAGLAKGDIITAVDDIPIANTTSVSGNTALVAAVHAHRPGDTVTITFQRAGETKKVKVTLDSDGGNPPK